MDYLKHMGNAVANFLQPFGVDVDINVEHKGERSKCTGTQPSAPPAPDSESSEHQPPPESSQINDSPPPPGKEEHGAVEFCVMLFLV